MEDNIKEKAIADLLFNELSYAYCDNCGTTDCDDCHRKYQNWSLGEGTAENLAHKIIKLLKTLDK